MLFLTPPHHHHHHQTPRNHVQGEGGRGGRIKNTLHLAITNQTFEGGKQSHLQLIMSNRNQKGCFPRLLLSQGSGGVGEEAGSHRGGGSARK